MNQPDPRRGQQPSTSAAETADQVHPVPPVPKELPKWLVGTVAAGLLLVTAGVLIMLWLQIASTGASGPALLNAQLDAVKIAASVAVGGGGLFALYLAVRRQRTTETDLRLRDRAQRHNEQVAVDTRAHQERVAEATEADALQRRVTDLYAQAVGQLGSDNAVVRLGGLYALERLAQDTPHLRQTVADVMCAYLRMPFNPPVAKVQKVRESGGLLAVAHNRQSITDNIVEQSVRRPTSSVVAKAVIENDVRRTAQRLLRDHLRPGLTSDGKPTNPKYWGNDITSLDLTSATLVDASFSECVLPEIDFTHARFVGYAYFENTTFSAATSFRAAKFSHAHTLFGDAHFKDMVDFMWTTFEGCPRFSRVHFGGFARFHRAMFHFGVDFGEAIFDAKATLTSEYHESANFRNTIFRGEVMAGTSRFHKGSTWDHSRFEHKAEFNRAVFNGQASFQNITGNHEMEFNGATFASSAYFNDATAHKGIVMHGARAKPDGHFRWPQGWRVRKIQETDEWGELTEDPPSH